MSLQQPLLLHPPQGTAPADPQRLLRDAGIAPSISRPPSISGPPSISRQSSEIRDAPGYTSDLETGSVSSKGYGQKAVGVGRSPLLGGQDSSLHAHREPPPLNLLRHQSEPSSSSRAVPQFATNAWDSGRTYHSLKTLHPLQRCHKTLAQRGNFNLHALPGPAAVQALSYPTRSECLHCGCRLNAEEARHGNGLCAVCSEKSAKACMRCKEPLGITVFQWGSGLCKPCYNACEKKCRICKRRLHELGQLHWGTGLCNHCYDNVPKQCSRCRHSLTPHEMSWRSELCDACYDEEVMKNCAFCKTELQAKDKRWGTGLCDKCFDKTEKTCRGCGKRIHMGFVRWQNRLCETCYDEHAKKCKVCLTDLSQADLHSGLCAKCREDKKTICKRCKLEIPDNALHWGFGLCDPCYDAVEKTCRKCKKDRVMLGDHGWQTALCEKCYRSQEKNCRLCASKLTTEELLWQIPVCGSCYKSMEKKCRVCKEDLKEEELQYLSWNRKEEELQYPSWLCNSCYDNCEKQCSGCGCKILLGQMHWGTGLCDSCYDKEILIVRHPESQPLQKLSAGVNATIAAQMVFYLAPESVRPSLFIEIQGAGYKPDAATCFAGVLTTGSVAGMAAPLLLSKWAQSRGEREVYVGITLAAAVAAVSFLVAPNVVIVALAWAVINAPPSIRGVRATYFARVVQPHGLSRAGQLASTAGLVGGLAGPLISAAMHKLSNWMHADRLETDAFRGVCLLAAAACLICALALHMCMEKRERSGSKSSAAKHDKAGHARCDRCLKKLDENQIDFQLCETCNDGYGGPGVSFQWFCRYCLLTFCALASLLEVSMNACVIAAFQPLAVQAFGWGNNSIAAINFVGAGLSVLVSQAMVVLDMKERNQIALAAGLYVGSVLLLATPPLSQWRLAVAVLLGFKAQILFMAPFTSIFSLLIGKARVTNQRTTVLCLAPAIGAAVGTAIAPLFIDRAGTLFGLVFALPAVLAVVIIGTCWDELGGNLVDDKECASCGRPYGDDPDANYCQKCGRKRFRVGRKALLLIRLTSWVWPGCGGL
eukprot:TRINITY_DN49966_c0_g1_i1.p1 TRINITY_DN49966_c0_g1~~TRINITY_DN49966_c0_g1_i1.p1  ORF type:complete len:1061 (+),score=118.11 TRINITY_DN49966_c0_g1_i1:46-3183(+)